METLHRRHYMHLAGTRNELESFLARLNTTHRTLRFTWSISNERIEFLDLNIFKGRRFNTNRHLDISTHFKKTNTFQYLHFSSSHPRSVFKGLVKGEAIRFLRSNTDPHTYNKTINKFREHLFLGTLHTPPVIASTALLIIQTTREDKQRGEWCFSVCGVCVCVQLLDVTSTSAYAWKLQMNTAGYLFVFVHVCVCVCVCVCACDAVPIPLTSTICARK